MIHDEFQDIVQLFETNAFFRLFGFHIVNYEEGDVIIELTVRDDLMNVSDVLHGGVHATMIDTVMGLVIRSVTKRTPFTIDMDVRFFIPVKEGKVTARARVIHQGYKIVTAEGELLQNGQVVSKGTGTFKVK